MSQKADESTDIPETIQSLLVAFSLALAFRGFVVEGFVIPTGSMAPTLLGQHYRLRTSDTGYEYALDPTSVVQKAMQDPNAAIAFVDCVERTKVSEFFETPDCVQGPRQLRPRAENHTKGFLVGVCVRPTQPA